MKESKNTQGGPGDPPSKKSSRKSEVYKRQIALNRKYSRDPEVARIRDLAVVHGKNLADPFRTEVVLNPELEVPLKVGVHRAVGGDHDHPNPGDILCAALASCYESTLRLIANRLGIGLNKTRVSVTAEVDVRGTLGADRRVPVGFQSMHMDIEVEVQDSPEKMAKTLLQATKHSCVVYQTLKNALPIGESLHISRAHTA